MNALEEETMGKRCCVSGCQSNYATSRAKKPELKALNDEKNSDREKIAIFGIPSKSKCPEERRRWIRAIPYLTEDYVDSLKTNPAICARHWPANFETKTNSNGTKCLLHPPNVFEGVPVGDVPTPSARERPTKRCRFEVRTKLEDELPRFKSADCITYETLVSQIGDHEFINSTITSFETKDGLWIQSVDFFAGVPNFAILIDKNLSFSAFHLGVECKIPSLSAFRLKKLDAWSKVEEAIRFLRCKETSRHQNILKEQIDSMKAQPKGSKVYSPDVLIRAFNYYSTSRALYEKLREDFKLPSVKTLYLISNNFKSRENFRF